MAFDSASCRPSMASTGSAPKGVLALHAAHWSRLSRSSSKGRRGAPGATPRRGWRGRRSRSACSGPSEASGGSPLERGCVTRACETSTLNAGRPPRLRIGRPLEILRDYRAAQYLVEVVDLHRLDDVRVEASLGAALAILILPITRQRDEAQRLSRRMPQL